MSMHDTRRYNHQRYTQLVEDTFAEIKKLGELKGGEYSGDDDRLLNFRRNAADMEVPKETIWRVYAAKHWDAIGQYIKDIQSGKARTRLESLSGRCDDLIVYLLLFKAMLDESGPDKDDLKLGWSTAKDDGADALAYGLLRPAKERAAAEQTAYNEEMRQYKIDTAKEPEDYVLRSEQRLVPRRTTEPDSELRSKHTQFYELVDEMPISSEHKAFLKKAASELPIGFIRAADKLPQPQPGPDVAHNAFKE